MKYSLIYILQKPAFFGQPAISSWQYMSKKSCLVKASHYIKDGRDFLDIQQVTIRNKYLDCFSGMLLPTECPLSLAHSYIATNLLKMDKTSSGMLLTTVCPISLVHSYIATHLFKMDKTSWTYSIGKSRSGSEHCRPLTRDNINKN